jgi:autotransporter-associated beta strand protein
MKPLASIFLFLWCGTAAAQIAIVDNPDSPWAGHNASKVIMSEAVTVGTAADMFILDIQTYGNSTWNGCNLLLNGTPLIQATAQIPSGTPRIDTAIYYLANPPTGSLTLSGTFATGCTAAQANYYTLSGVDTTAALVTGGTIAGTTPTASLTLTTTSGAWAAIDQASMYPGPTTGSYGASTGSPNTLNSGGNASSVFGSDGYVQGLAAGSNTFTASLDYPSATNHALSVAVFTGLPVTGPPTWIGSSGSWSQGANWSTSVPNTAGAVAVFSQTASTTETITLDDNPTIGSLTLGNSGLSSVSYDLTANILTLNNSGSGAVLTVSGSQEIDSAITGSEALIMQGSGQLILSGSNTYTGGTDVESGTLIVNSSSAIPDGSSLTVGAGGTFIFDSSVSGAPAVTMAGREAGSLSPVPEPGTACLAAIFLSTIFLSKLWKRTMRALLLIGLLSIAATAYAGEGGTGLMSPEPGSIALLGAAVLFGVPAYWIRRRRKQQAEAKDATE